MGTNAIQNIKDVLNGLEFRFGQKSDLRTIRMNTFLAGYYASEVRKQFVCQVHPDLGNDL